MRLPLSRKMPGVGHWLAGLCLFLTAWLHGVAVQAADILLTGAEESPGVQSFVQALSELRPTDRVRFQPLASLPAPGKLPASLRLILLDLPSLDWRLQEPPGPATLVLRISRLQAQQRFGNAQPPSHLSLLWSDPMPGRQLQLIRRLLPQARRVGVLFDRHSEFLLQELHLAARSLDLEIVGERWDNTRDSRPLQALLKNSDVLLGLDDPDLYNPKTAKNLLLSSYSRQLALIGPNVAFVRAGSLASSYSDQSDWLAILDALLDRPPASWPRTLYPDRFKVSSNAQVARSLGIELPDEVSVAKDLAEGERRP
ncbi:ABC transporter substrate-binding protein [Pseudomonas sp. COR58]|uniref:ABC transporter substrate-binding protein n=1 Tax=Pseudomonas ekonensis TaxID=2842353 RepID=A0ABS6P9Q9_9PSED|nr:ABC transporter substrate-binding protein [Pseudomonas ekonensis]MBV4457215.1 ABC transporter substrate-binding protein [Pseudomonas ekonensis]